MSEFVDQHAMFSDEEWTTKYNDFYKLCILDLQKTQTHSVSSCGKYNQYSNTKKEKDLFNRKIIAWVEEVLLEAKSKYYQSSEHIMSDMRYDRFEDILKRLDPDSKVLKTVGYEVKK